jgi:hypothetical protein
MGILSWLFGRRERKATMEDFYRIKAEVEERGRLEDLYFDEWWEANVHRFPLKEMRFHTASTDIFLSPMMEAIHHKEFAEYFQKRLQERATNVSVGTDSR